MADRESILAWLRGAKFRYVFERDPPWHIVIRLCDEGRAERINGSNRFRATDSPSNEGDPK